MKALVCILLLLSYYLAFAQVEELPEISSDELQTNWLESFYRELSSSKYGIKTNSRFRYDGHNMQQLHSLRGGKDGYSVTINGSNNGNNEAYANFRINSISKGFVQELAIGSLNPSWGLGAVLKQSSGKQAIFQSGNPSHPEYSSPQGVAMRLKHGNAQAFGMASHTMRPANIKDGYISTLYKKHNPERSYVWEKLFAGGMHLSYKQLNMGAMAYYQSYELPFVDSTMQQDLHAYSATVNYRAGIMYMECEAALIGKEPTLKGILNMKHLGFGQQLAVYLIKNKQLPAYSAKPGVISFRGQHSEINWNTDYSITKHLDSQLRIALSRNDGDVKPPTWQARSIVALRYKHEPTAVGLQLSRINKELVALADSSYVNSMPMHYRVKLNISHKLKPSLELSTEFRYHYEEKMKDERNSFFWENRIRKTAKHAFAEAGLRNWQSLYSVSIPDAEMGDAEGVSLLKGEDSQVFVKLGSRLKSFHFASELRYSLHSHNLQIYVNVGI